MRICDRCLVNDEHEDACTTHFVAGTYPISTDYDRALDHHMDLCQPCLESILDILKTVLVPFHLRSKEPANAVHPSGPS